LRYTFAAQLIDQNWEAALDILKKIQLSYPDFDTQLAQFETSLRYQRDQGYRSDQYAAFLGTYRHFNSGRTVSFIKNSQNDLLIGQAPNGSSIFFPLREQQLINFDDWSFTESIELAKDSSGVPYGVEFTWIRGDVPIIDHPFYWKIDSRIEAAEAALMSRDYAAAEPAYQKAIEVNPNHYFLRDGLAHIRYASTKTAAELLDQYRSVAGTYGDRRLWVENGRLFYKRASSGNGFNSTMELFPVSETRYCNLIRQGFQLEFQYENGQPIASYSFLYDRETQTWKQNPNETDLIRKQE
jgi:tetratricopeptide (TPR) repeat protein